MPSRIRILDENTINKIAAGEVIENPSSVIKELVENSLDAGATDICVEIRSGGRQLIRITDNGCGMNPDDALLCLERHATSKLKEIDHLHTLDTMGFRGEAIPSIASISKFTLYTRPHDHKNPDQPGTLIIVDGGKIMRCAPVECAFGTTIEVKSLFFNVPVRKKFQKSPAYDVAEIQRVLTQLALGNPEICFSLISDQETLFSLSTSSKNSFIDSLGERVRQLLGDVFFNSLLPLQGTKADCHIHGFVGNPASARHNRSGQSLLINRRAVSVPSVSFAVRDGYGTMLQTGKHPIYVLHMSLPMELLDVNVHPQKREVRLRHERLLKEFVAFSVETALQKDHFRLTPLPFSDFPPIETPTGKEYGFGYGVIERGMEVQGHGHRYGEEIIGQEKGEIEKRPYALPEIPQILPNTRQQEPAIDLFPINIEPKKESGKKLRVLMTLPDYIIAAEKDPLVHDLYLIDQKKAHARIIYERLLSTQSEVIEQQMLLIPHLFELPIQEAQMLCEALPMLQKMGIQIKEFGPLSFVIDAIPVVFGNVEINKLVDEIVKNSYERADVSLIDIERKKKIAFAASHAAICAKKRLDVLDAQQLLDQLVNCQTSKQCPNGKTSFVILTSEDIKKYLI